MQEWASVTVETVRHNGAVIVSAVVDNMLISRTYYGYTRGEAVEMFRETVRRHGYGTVRLVVAP